MAQGRRRRGTSDAAIDEARTRLAHTATVAPAATRAADALDVDSFSAPSDPIRAHLSIIELN